MPETRDIAASVAAYDAWLRTRCAVVEADLAHKHAAMRADAFGFLRATYFRWAECVPALLPDLIRAPIVPAVGDVHLENFGLWRDVEGRLAWGINDLDEAARMPFTLDLLRLMTSVQLAQDTGWPKPADAAAAILEGYGRHLIAPEPFVLDERHGWLRALAMASPDRRAEFWRRMDSLPVAMPPAAWRQALLDAAPRELTDPVFRTRVAGMGSLGRPRYVLVGDWKGGRVVREAKARVPSAWDWARGEATELDVMPILAAGPHRASDPIFAIRPEMVLRRLAPDSRKLELPAASDIETRTKLLSAVGGELANLHRSAGNADAINADLAGRASRWLTDTSDIAVAMIKNDLQSWREDCG